MTKQADINFREQQLGIMSRPIIKNDLHILKEMMSDS